MFRSLVLLLLFFFLNIGSYSEQKYLSKTREEIHAISRLYVIHF